MLYIYSGPQAAQVSGQIPVRGYQSLSAIKAGSLRSTAGLDMGN